MMQSSRTPRAGARAPAEDEAEEKNEVEKMDEDAAAAQAREPEEIGSRSDASIAAWRAIWRKIALRNSRSSPLDAFVVVAQTT